MCFKTPKVPTPVAPPAAIDVDLSAQQAAEEETKRRKSAMGSASTNIAGMTKPPATAPKTALGA